MSFLLSGGASLYTLDETDKSYTVSVLFFEILSVEDFSQFPHLILITGQIRDKTQTYRDHDCSLTDNR